MNYEGKNKILLLSPLPPPSGGIARWTEGYLTWMKGKADVVVVNTSVTGKRVYRASSHKNIVNEINRTIRIIRETIQAVRNDKKIAVMHLNTSCSEAGIFRDFLCVKIAQRAGIPVVLHCHCNVEDQLGNKKQAINIFKKIAGKAKKVLVLNKKSLAFVKSIGVNSVEICPNFLVEGQIAQEHTISEKVKTILFVGNVCVEKGIDLIYAAALQCPELSFRIIGPMSDKVAGLARPSNVVLLGQQNMQTVQAELDSADVFLFPSLSEGFSIALLEAMGRGVPVIATDVGANADMVENKGGKIIPAGESQEIVRAIQNMSEAAIRQEMSAWNIRKVKENYTKELVLNEIFHKLKNL